MSSLKELDLNLTLTLGPAATGESGVNTPCAADATGGVAFASGSGFGSGLGFGDATGERGQGEG